MNIWFCNKVVFIVPRKYGRLPHLQKTELNFDLFLCSQGVLTKASIVAVT